MAVLPKREKLLLILILVLSLLPAVARAEDWPKWRGPQGNDVVDESSGWEAGAWPPKEEWSRNVGEGCTSPLVVGDRVYTLGWRSNRDTLFCLDAATGAEIWKQSYECPEYGRKSDGDKGIYSGVTSTPSYDADTGLLYSLSTDGDLVCWNTRQSGKRVWDMNLYDEFDPPMRPRVGRSGRRDYGYTSSPLVWGDWVVVEVGSPEHGNTLAFDKQTGRRLWASQSKDHAGHAGGLAPIMVEGAACAAVLTFSNLLVMRLDRGHEGETVAEYPWQTDFANSIASPAVHENNVLITSAYNHYAICKLRITLRGAEKVWEVEESSNVCTPVVYNGHVYWACRQLHCLDFETGKVKWKGKNELGTPGSCIVTRDGRLITWANRGDLVLTETADRSPDRYTELARIEGVFRTDVWPHVVLSNGCLYCKDRAGNLKRFALRP